MSYVTKNIDGSYEVGILYQDGYDRIRCDTREEAIEAYRCGIRSLGPFRADGEPPIAGPDPVIRDKSAWPVVVAVGEKTVTINPSVQLADALRLALARGRLDEGSRYEVRVVLVKASEGNEPYQGMGI